MSQAVIDRFQSLVALGDLVVRREGAYGILSDAESGGTVETYVDAYPSERDAREGNYALPLMYGLFFDPDSISFDVSSDGWGIWERLEGVSDETVARWNILEVIEDRPAQLGGDSDGVSETLAGSDLSEYLFQLYLNHLSE